MGEKKKKRINPIFYQLYQLQADTVLYTCLTVLQVCTLTQRDFFLFLRKQVAIPQKMVIAAGRST